MGLGYGAIARTTIDASDSGGPGSSAAPSRLADGRPRISADTSSLCREATCAFIHVSMHI